MRKLNEEKSDYIVRLKRIEGQLRGIQQMIDDNRNYSDVATQLLSAVNALKNLSNNIIRDHLKRDSLSKLSKKDIAEVEEVLDWLDKNK